MDYIVRSLQQNPECEEPGSCPHVPALRAIQDEAGSSIPALGYTVPYAIGNILLTAWGPILIALMS